VLELRVGGGAGRPLLRGGAAPTLERLAAERRDAYEAAAHVAVDTVDRTIDEVADAVLVAARGSDTWSG
jgi:shikimate kinase